MRVAWTVSIFAASLAATVVDAQDSEAAAENRSTGIHGRVLDRDSGEGLVDAPVLAQGEGQTYSAITEEGGAYRLYVPPGRYTVRSYYDLYHGARLDDVRVYRGRFSHIRLILTPIDEEEVEVEEMEVVYRADTTTAAAQDQLRRAASGIGEGMGAEQMSQSGASDASHAARRVVGVTIAHNQLIVRGMGGRYSRVLLNGVSVPSVDPDVPGVDLDLFPTSVIDSLNVSKAFLPDLPGDWAGGLMQINSVTFPRELTVELGLSLGADTQSTFRPRLSYDGGGLDWLGFDDGTRALPGAVPNERLRITNSGSFQTEEQIEAIAEEFENTWQYDRTRAWPNLGVEFTVGNSISLGEQRRFGYLANFSYDYESSRETGLSRPRPTIAEDGSLSPFNDFVTESGTDEVQLAGIATASLELGADHVLTVLSMFNHSMEDETSLQVGESGELAAGETTEKWQLSFLTRTLVFNQLLGDHRNLGGTRLRLQWSGFAAIGRRSEPDRRTIVYGPQGGYFRWLEKAGSGERFFSYLNQLEYGGTLNLRFPLWAEAWGTVGGMVRISDRDFEIRRFRMLQHPDNMDQAAYQAPPENLFDEQGIGTLTRMAEFTRADDSYRSQQNLYAAYAMLETPLVGGLSMAGGVRAEIFSQEVASRSPFPAENTGASERSDRTDVDILPGIAFRYELTEDMFLRASYGWTVGRPQIRELAPYVYYDFFRDRNVEGNPDLRRTQIHNADLRWEWFFGEGEILAASAFYKHFIDPIELQILNPVNYDSQFVNADSARNVGGELELRLGLGRLTEALDNFSLEANLALINSRVSLPEELSGAVSAERRLFDQPPYVANLSLRFDDPATRVSLALIYNVVGPRITDVGTRVSDTILPNIEEQPFHSLNLLATWDVTEHWKLKLKIQNLLLQSRDFRQGDFLLARRNIGTSFSVGASYRY